MRKIFFSLVVFLFSALTFAAEPGTEWFPLAGQSASWSVTGSGASEMLNFNGTPVAGTAIATNFGGFAPPFSTMRLKFRTTVSADGAKSTIIVLGSNAIWGEQGIVLDINKDRVFACQDFVYFNPFPTLVAVKLSSNEDAYQAAISNGTTPHTFVIDVTTGGLITVTVNGIVCATSYQVDATGLSRLNSNQYVLFAPSFTGYVIRDVVVKKNSVFKSYFPTISTPTEYTINASVNNAAQGSVTGAGTYDITSYVTLIATPVSGYRFVNWTENGSEISTSASLPPFLPSAARTLVANFEPVYIITASANNATLGSVSGAGTYNLNASVTLIATPTSGNHFVNWTENGSEVSTSATLPSFSATAARTLVANFEPDAITLGLGQTNASSITCSTCNVNVPADGELLINTNKVLKYIDVTAGGKLTLGAGNTLTVTNGLFLRSSAAATATFVDTNNSNPQSFSGNIRQTYSAGRNWYTASPITAGSASVLNKGTSVQTYSEANKGWTTLIGSDALVAGKGYVSVASSGAGTSGNVTFTGTFNTGTIEVPVTRTAGAKEGFNLVANPYPSYLDWSLVTADAANSAIGTTMWFRTTTSEAAYAYSTYNSTGNVAVTNNAATAITKFIPPFQAFWIRVNSGTAATNFTLKNSMRAHRDVTPNTLKAPQQDSRPLIRLQVSNGVDIDETVIYFDENAENNLDSYDSPKMFNNEDSKPEIYTQISSDKLVINGLKSIANGLEIPIGFVAGAANSYSISSIDIKNTDAYKVVLVDKLRNKETELGTGVSYNFDADVTPAATSRFSLLFRTPGASTGTDNMLSENITVLVNAQNKIQINAPENSTYTIYNSIGVLLEQGLTKATMHTANIYLQSGVYVVKVSNISTRVIIK